MKNLIELYKTTLTRNFYYFYFLFLILRQKRIVILIHLELKESFSLTIESRKDFWMTENILHYLFFVTKKVILIERKPMKYYFSSQMEIMEIFDLNEKEHFYNLFVMARASKGRFVHVCK